MKKNHSAAVLSLLICGMVFLASCGRYAADSAPVEQAAMSGNTWVSEAYTGIEDPRLRGQGTPVYWPPLSEQSEAAGFGYTSSPYAVTSVTLEPVTYGTQQLYRLNGSDYLIAKPDEENDNIKTAVKNRAQELLTLSKENPKVKFYTYFVNRATNCDWYGISEGIFAYDYADYFESRLGEDSGITCGQFFLRNLQDYMDTGYKLDFHLNHIGAYRAYQDLYTMLTKDMELKPMLAPLREVDYDSLHTVGQTIQTPDSVDIPEESMDIFKTYQFDYGDYTSYVNGRRATIGMESEYAKGKFSTDPAYQHWRSFYGGQNGVIRFEFHQPGQPNLLILSDSQGLPIRKLLASHFNRTIYLDGQQAGTLDLNQVIADNDIDVVIFLGQISQFERFNGSGT